MPVAGESIGTTGGPFGRVREKRFVRHVLNLQHQPPHWLPMDISQQECKIVEVRKYSAEYHELDTKFRRPNFELIAAYAIQNPFLYGMYQLRKEQMRMQVDCEQQGKQHLPLKEKYFYYPTTFDKLESIARNNFTRVTNVDESSSSTDENGTQQEVKFYGSSEKANDAFRGSVNPRILIIGRLLISLCHLLPDITDGASSVPVSTKRGHKYNRQGVLIDTLSNEDRSLFLKFNSNEMYPDHILVYRDRDGPPDQHTPRLTGFFQHCQLSYRAGTRFNPAEIEFHGKEGEKKLAAERALQAFTAAAKMEEEKSKKEKKKKKKSSDKKRKFSLGHMFGAKSNNNNDDDDDDTKDLGPPPKYVEGEINPGVGFKLQQTDGNGRGGGMGDSVRYAETGAIPKRPQPPHGGEATQKEDPCQVSSGQVRNDLGDIDQDQQQVNKTVTSIVKTDQDEVDQEAMELVPMVAGLKRRAE